MKIETTTQILWGCLVVFIIGISMATYPLWAGSDKTLPVEDNIGETLAEINNDGTFGWVQVGTVSKNRVLYDAKFYQVRIPPYLYTIAISHSGHIQVLNMEQIDKQPNL